MRIDIISVIPELIQSNFEHSILKRAQNKGLAEIHLHNLHDYSHDPKHKRVDDYPFGGEAGMVMRIEPVDNILTHLKSERHYDEIIYTSPDGEMFDQKMANSMSMLENIIILCGQHEGTNIYYRAMFSGSCAGIVRCWIEGGFAESEETMVKLFANPPKHF